MDVSLIVDSAGEKFSQTEGTIRDIVFSPDENAIFVGTEDTLVGVLIIRPNENYDNLVSDIYDEDTGDMAILNTGISPYLIELETVLILPLKEFFLVPSRDSLMVVSRNTRLLLLVDWSSYAQRARRFILPDIGDEENGGHSSPINSVLPTGAESGELFLTEETICVTDAAVSDLGDSLILTYDNGVTRLFTITGTNSPMSTILACPAVHAIATCGDLVAIVNNTNRAIYCYSISKGTCYKLEWLVTLKSVETITSISWCLVGRFLIVSHYAGITVIDKMGLVLFSHATNGIVMTACISSACKLIGLVSSTFSHIVEFLPVGISGGYFSKCQDDYHSQILVSRDSMKLFTFPSRQWISIPAPTNPDGTPQNVSACAVQLNASSIYVLAKPLMEDGGFSLWSAYTSSMASVQKRLGRWEYMDEGRSEVEFFGFISESVFVSKFFHSNDLLLWSVYKRLDPRFIVGKYQLPTTTDILTATTKSTGYLLLMYRGRIDVFRLVVASGTYSLNLVSKHILQDIPQTSSCMRIHYVTGLNETINTILCQSGSGLYTTDGKRIAENVSKIFAAWCVGRAKDRTITQASVDDNDSDDEEVLSSASDYSIDDEECHVCEKLSVTCAAQISPTTTGAVHRGNPLVWIIDTRGGISMWIIDDDFSSNRITCIGRFSDEFSASYGQSILGVSGKFGVLSVVQNEAMRVSFVSAIHPLLQVCSPEDSWEILQTIEQIFLAMIVEVWLHSAITNALPIIATGPPSNPPSSSLYVCDHTLSRTIVNQLLDAVWISSHFQSVFPTAFASSVRKTEPHIMFPIVMAKNLLSVRTVEDVFSECMHSRLREAALLLLILQDKYGPIDLREKFVLPLFKESLESQNYSLSIELQNFYHSGVRQEADHEIQPSSPPSGDAIEKIVTGHINHLVRIGDWIRLIRFAQICRLDLGERFGTIREVVGSDRPVTPDQQLEESGNITDPTILILGKQFKSILIGDDLLNGVVFDYLFPAFTSGGWKLHAKAIAIAFGKWDALEDLRKEEEGSLETDAPFSTKA
jgi:hypothetical protein